MYTHNPAIMEKSDLNFLDRINELVAINNERFKTYSRAMEKTHSPEFRSLCEQNKERTVYFNMQLIQCLVSYDQMPVNRETGLGKAYRFGILRRKRFLLQFRRVNRHACQWCDKVALSAYKQLLEDIQHLPGEISRIIRHQLMLLENDQKYSVMAL